MGLGASDLGGVPSVATPQASAVLGANLGANLGMQNIGANMAMPQGVAAENPRLGGMGTMQGLGGGAQVGLLSAPSALSARARACVGVCRCVWGRGERRARGLRRS